MGQIKIPNPNLASGGALDKQAQVYPKATPGNWVSPHTLPAIPGLVTLEQLPKAIQPSPAGPGSVHEPPPTNMKPIGLDAANEKTFSGNDPALGSNEALPVAVSMPHPLDAVVPDPGVIKK